MFYNCKDKGRENALYVQNLIDKRQLRYAVIFVLLQIYVVRLHSEKYETKIVDREK